jgi:hypothetical protein
MHLSPRFRIHRRSPAAIGGGHAPSSLPYDLLDPQEWPASADEEQVDRDLTDYAGAEATTCLAVFVA